MPHTTQAQVAEQYRDDANLNARVALHRRFSTNTYGWARWVYDQLQLPENCDILELGCGPAHLWRQNAQRVPRGWRLTLSDSSPGMIESAQANLRDSGLAPVFRVVDAQSIPYDDGRFDAVIANHVLYHVPGIDKALSEICRVLRPGAPLYASTVGRGHMRGLRELALQFLGDASPPPETPALPFLLENGGEQLAHWFSSVRCERYEDGLVVTEAEPLVAYLLSSMVWAPLLDDRRAALTAYVEAEIARQGAIRISKDSGLFTAHRPPDA